MSHRGQLAKGTKMIATHDTRQISVSHDDPRFAHLHEYLSYWAFEEKIFQALQAQVRPQIATHLSELVASDPKATTTGGSGRYTYEVTADGVALITMRGPMMKFESSFSGASTVATRRKVRNAVNDQFVKSIVLIIDSPGGTVSGTKELADDVAAAAKKKPLYVYVEDYCCSAAYWVGSQATKMFSNATALVGCIGTYMVVYDQSKQYAAEGIVVHVVRAGDFKGAGVSGTEITAEQLAEWQTEVNELNDFFVRGVASGRRVAIKTAEGWADGRAHVAGKAHKMGLIDGVTTLDATIDMAARAKPPRSAGKADGKPADGVVDEDPEDKPLGGNPAPESEATDVSGDPVAIETVHSPQQTTESSERSDVTNPEEDPAMSTEAPKTETIQSAADARPAAAPVAPKAATLAEIKAGCPGADNDFIVGQLEKNVTLSDAQSAWMSEQNRRLAAKDTQIEQAKLANASAGNAPLVDGKGGGASAANFEGDAIDAYHASLKEKIAAGSTRPRAVASIAKENPELHQAYLDACMAEKKNPSGRKLVAA